MPNGLTSTETWQRAEGLLQEIDNQLSEFAQEKRMEIVRNYHNWPSRFLQTVEHGLYKSIQIVLADEHELTFLCSVIAWQDRDGRRFIAHKNLVTGVDWPEIRDNLTMLLQESLSVLDSRSESDLVLVG